MVFARNRLLLTSENIKTEVLISNGKFASVEVIVQ